MSECQLAEQLLLHIHAGACQHLVLHAHKTIQKAITTIDNKPFAFHFALGRFSSNGNLPSILLWAASALMAKSARRAN